MVYEQYTLELLAYQLNKLQQSQEQLDKQTSKHLASIEQLQQDIEKLVPKPTSR